MKYGLLRGIVIVACYVGLLGFPGIFCLGPWTVGVGFQYSGIRTSLLRASAVAKIMVPYILNTARVSARPCPKSPRFGNSNLGQLPRVSYT